jgi:CRISPR-associated endonuclease Cas1
MLARPGAIAAMRLGDRLASRAVHAQALAVTNGLDLAIARELIAGKLDGQRRILVRLRAETRELDEMRNALSSADSIEKVRVIEANVAALYFAAWRTVRIRFRERDLARIPIRWLRADSRASVLTGAPRAATSPINAMRNYLFACLESEARLALLAHGCDPQIACLHSDQRNRDSLALDAMEPVRADVDAFLLDLLEDRTFTARDFGELPNGICRIAAPLTHELAHASALARMPAADRGAPRASLPRIPTRQALGASRRLG